jgi:glycerophosphoryl diester phosphodiesterase
MFDKQMSTQHIIIGHRGASGLAPENTLASFRKAFELGTKWVEFDVRLCRDATPVICHDDTTTRTTNLADKKIIDLSLEEIKQLDAGSWFSPEFSGETIPTFAETLQFLAKHNMQANIELKSNPGYEAQTVLQVLDVFNSIWPKDLMAVFSSFDVGMLKILRDHQHSLPLALLRRIWNTDDDAVIAELNCCAVHLNAQYITAAHIATIKKLHLPISCYTIDKLEEAQSLFDLGVKGIFTNFPNLFAENNVI